ncbi:hypothetical protein F0562_017434 [Nyssa sinensis]|uniref:Chromo domain-containing protein n=1 Tax=Nyssa sinensis TaxID=561372 RepID=A0A5J4ZIV2_9ASTE|nr:hypothetical protein F0562_017434 [Nyssa sinensis]
MGSTSTRPLSNPPTLDTKALVPVQRLSPLQMKERRARGLCYNCDEKWGLGHKCKLARLFILDCADSEEGEPQPIQHPQLLEAADCPSGGKEVNQERTPKISIHALVGSPSPKTMRILGHVNGCAVVILIDTGSTHNFMDPSIQQRAHLQSQSTAGLLVRVANGDTMFSTGKCEDIQLHMQGNTYHTDFYILTLGGCDIVLGVQWLSTLGPILWDFVKLRMEFNLLDSKHVLQGITPTEVSLMDGEQFEKAMTQDKRGVVLQVLPPDAIHISALETDPCLSKLLDQFQTDHQSLKYLLEQKVGTPMQQKWLTKLLGFDFLVEYKKGKDNLVADALSRKFEDAPATLAALSFPSAHWLSDLRVSYSEDPKLQKLISEFAGRDLDVTKYSMKDGLLFYKGQFLWIPTPTIVGSLARDSCSSVGRRHPEESGSDFALTTWELAGGPRKDKAFCGLKRTERNFDIGDWVYLRLQPYKQHLVVQRKNLKLSPRFYGPYQIVERIGRVAYRLDLPSTSLLYPVFHVSCLKRKLGARNVLVTTIPPVAVGGGPQAEPEEIFQRRLRKKKGHAVSELLVKWKGLGFEEASWVDFRKLQKNFPDLEGKVF